MSCGSICPDDVAWKLDECREMIFAAHARLNMPLKHTVPFRVISHSGRLNRKVAGPDKLTVRCDWMLLDRKCESIVVRAKFDKHMISKVKEKLLSFS